MARQYRSLDRPDSAQRAKVKQQMQRETYHNMRRQQSQPKALLGALLGAILAMWLFLFMAGSNSTLVWLYMLPAVAVGLGARWLGKCFEWQLLLPVPLITLLLYGLALWLLLRFHASDLLIVPLCCGISLYCARRSLSPMEQSALWQAKLDQH
ncbi:hypothetical protein [Shewanella algae]|uniref:hypothetical protein n=1 Tax=Shewanella algae TaxID=38313 RepID=UPI0008DD575A|nr:hypothetical protein [Shewanella algae]OHY52937.1 hypothetical protein BEH76_12745 [Shewanella algae]